MSWVSAHQLKLLSMKWTETYEGWKFFIESYQFCANFKVEQPFDWPTIETLFVPFLVYWTKITLVTLNKQRVNEKTLMFPMCLMINAFKVWQQLNGPLNGQSFQEDKYSRDQILVINGNQHVILYGKEVRLEERTSYRWFDFFVFSFFFFSFHVTWNEKFCLLLKQSKSKEKCR